MSAGETNASGPLMTCRNPMTTPKPGGMDAPGPGQTQPADGLSGVRHEGGVTPAQASMRNVGTCRRDAKEKLQQATPGRARVPMRGTGAESLVVGLKVLYGTGPKGRRCPA